MLVVPVAFAEASLAAGDPLGIKVANSTLSAGGEYLVDVTDPKICVDTAALADVGLEPDSLGNPHFGHVEGRGVFSASAPTPCAFAALALQPGPGTRTARQCRAKGRELPWLDALDKVGWAMAS